MLYVVAFVVAAGLGFAGSRMLRRPASAAQAASVARNVGGSLGTRKGLDAPELQRACFSEMVRHVRVNREGRTSAPGTYLLRLNPGDMSVVDEARRWFSDGLEQALRDAANQNGWRIDGAVSIDFESDPSRRPGVPVAVPGGRSAAGGPEGGSPAGAVAAGGRGAVASGPDATAVARVANGASSSAATGRARSRRKAPALALERSDTGERVLLDGTAITVGRSSDNTITTVDERISRSHARFEQIGGGWVVVDLDSANGTRVDASRIRPGSPIPVTAGMVIGIGPLDLSVVSLDVDSDSAGGPEAGTRALAEADRTRISQEVLGLPGELRRR